MLNPSIPLSGLPATMPDVYGQLTQMRELNDQRKVRQAQITRLDLENEANTQARDRKARAESIIRGTVKPVMGAPAGGVPGGQAPPNVAPPGVTAAPVQAAPQTLAGLNGPSLPNASEPPVSMPAQPGQPPPGLQGTPDWDVAIAQMRAEGLVEEAQVYEDGRMKRLNGILDQTHKQNTVVNDIFTKAGGVVAQIADQVEAPVFDPTTGQQREKTDAEKEATFQLLRPQWVAVIPGQLAADIPEHWNAQQVAALQTRGLSFTEYAKANLEAAKLGREALADRLTGAQKITQALASILPQAETPEQYNAALENYAMFPGGKDAVAQFPRMQPGMDFAKTKRAARDRGIAAKDQADLEIQRQKLELERAKGTGGGIAGMGDYALTGEEFLQTIPAQYRTLVKKVANYDLDLTRVSAQRTSGGQESERERLAKWATQYDPSFSMPQYAIRQTIRRDVTSGKTFNNIKSFNTAIAHLETLQKAAKALNNRAFTPWNTLTNLASQTGGSAAVTNFLAAATAVEGEAATAFKGTSGTDQEIKEWRQAINPSMSPAQLEGAVKTITELLAGRIQKTSSAYETGMGKPKDFHFLDAKSRTILEKQGVNVAEIDPVTQAFGPPPPPMPGAEGGAAGSGGTVTIQGPKGTTLQVTPAEAKLAPKGWTVVTAAPAAASALPNPGTQRKVGDEAWYNGVKVRITRIYPDGTVDTEPVK